MYDDDKNSYVTHLVIIPDPYWGTRRAIINYKAARGVFFLDEYL